MVHPGMVRYSSNLANLVNADDVAPQIREGAMIVFEPPIGKPQAGDGEFSAFDRIRARMVGFLGGFLAIAGAVLVLLTGLPGVTGVAEAGKAKFNKVLDVGDPAPDWKDLPGTDGKSHRLAEFRKAKALVVVFTCNHCPVAKQYEERLVEFAKKYEQRVQVVAISVSRNDADRLEKMKARATEAGFAFPYLRDESQQSGRAYGATVTPHFFVLDRDRKIAYMGAFDDNIFEPEKVEKHYLVDAVEAVLAGQEPRVRESLQRGCAIQYDDAKSAANED